MANGQQPEKSELNIKPSFDMDNEYKQGCEKTPDNELYDTLMSPIFYKTEREHFAYKLIKKLKSENEDLNAVLRVEALTLANVRNERDAIKSDCEANHVPAQALTDAMKELERCRAELELDRKVIAWANNSLFGSHGYFLSKCGGPPNEMHLHDAIEDLKSYCRKSGAELAESKELSQNLAIQLGDVITREATIRTAAQRVVDYCITPCNISDSTNYTTRLNNAIKALKEALSATSN